MYCRIGIDEWLRVPSVENVFAIGDCAGFVEGSGRPVLPALAQVRLTASFASFIYLQRSYISKRNKTKLEYIMLSIRWQSGKGSI